MNTFQEDVLTLYRKHSLYVGYVPAPIPENGQRELGSKLLVAMQELVLAIGENDPDIVGLRIAEALQGVFGAAVSYGIDIEPFWTLVHEHRLHAPCTTSDAPIFQSRLRTLNETQRFHKLRDDTLNALKSAPV